MHILIADRFDAELPRRLAAFGTVSESLDDIAAAELLIVRSKTRCDAALIARAPNLKLVIRGGVGLDNVDQTAAAARGIAVRNTPRASAIAVAELAMALLLAIPTRLVEGHVGMAGGQWLKSQLSRTELHGKTLGLLGLGNIGRQVARRARAFGMRVLAHDPYLDTSEDATLLPVLDELLAAADYVSLHLPLNDQTRGILGAEALARLRPGAAIVNTGRSDCVDLDAVAAALRAGRLRAYATDVWPSDPPPPDCPLLTAPGVIMTPHLGASSAENLARIGDEIVALVSAYRREETP